MNRILKFRCWKQNKWISLDRAGVWLRCHQVENAQGIDVWGPGGYTYPDTVLEQWTGLIDSQGKEIYEGDIVEYTEGIELGDKMIFRGVVVYDPIMGSYGYAPQVDKDCWNYPWEGIVKRPKVIGNIHENLELLKT